MPEHDHELPMSLGRSWPRGAPLRKSYELQRKDAPPPRHEFDTYLPAGRTTHGLHMRPRRVVSVYVWLTGTPPPESCAASEEGS